MSDALKIPQTILKKMLERNRKRKLEKEEQTMVDWEQENYFPDKIRNKMESMWEIPQIFHFLHLAREALNIPHLSMYEMERMLLIPRASKQLATIMTSLLSSPITKSKLRKIPPMPYEFWTNILAYKMKSWFKVYEGRRRDAVKVLESIGVEPEFWNVFPDAPLLNGKDFEELSFRQKVWLLKTVCDTVMHTRKTVQEELAKQPWEDQFETLLGTDRYGTRYIYFPQFLKTDLRVYRHCLDNTILSTVKPVRTEGKPCPDNNQTKQADATWKKIKQKKRKSRWSNGFTTKSKKKVNKCNEKNLNDCKCISDSARDSLINEDTNLSSTSTCSNNNNSNSNNNNINLDTINGKRSRSLSKCSEMSMESDKTQYKNLKSTSGYDTSSSRRTVSDNRSSQKMFKGFSSSSKDNCKIEIISNMLSDLSKNIVKNNVDKVDETVSSSVGELGVNTVQQYLEPVDQCIDKRDSLSNSSKTDDEKLHEIISVKCLNMDNQNSSNFQVSTTSKSDDEKLSETNISQGSTGRTSTSLAIEDSKKVIIKENGHLGKKKPNELVNKDTKTKLLGKSSKSRDDNEVESDDDKDLSLSELRSRLQKEAMEEDFSMDEDSEDEHRFKHIKNTNTEVWKQEVQDFNEMLSELSVSKFQLIADSVSSFRDLVSTLSKNCGKLNGDTAGDNESTYPCEMKLLKRMTELLSSLEEMESVLQDSTKKARVKLQKEWTNFKEGVEDQDSSGEGLGSNWWVLGSQGCPLPTPGDASLQTLPQPTLSPSGSQSVRKVSKNCQEDINSVNSVMPIKTEHKKSRKGQGESSVGEAQRCEYEKDEDQRNQATGEDKDNASEEEEQQSRRVLRARGVSSYTEQFYSDDEIEEKELDEWADVEAVYAAPSAQISASVANFTAKVKQADDRNNEEDSDQEWILPSSRKRKNKRPSANRRLKSFQHKLQSINELQEAATSAIGAPSNLASDKDKAKDKETPICQPKKPEEPCPSTAKNPIENNKDATENDPKETVPSAEPACKIENMESVHSELDIKDEGPIYDYPPSHPNNSYPTNVNPNYVMVKTEPTSMNYYVMQSNMVSPQTLIHPGGSLVSNAMPSMPQGYYVQGGQNYIVQNPQPGYVPAQAFQPQGPQMLAPQQFVSQPSYVPYMMPAAPPQRGYMPPGHQLANQSVPQSPSSVMPSSQPPSNRSLQVRYPPLRQMHPQPQPQPHPNGAVIRSSMPIRGNSPRATNPRGRMLQQQRGMPVKTQKRRPNVVAENPGQKTTSLIVLSDSDDEIEMIITEKTGTETETTKTKTVPRRNQMQKKMNVTSDTSVAKPKSAIPPQIMQRMSQGGISITPVKPAQPTVQNTSTQLVVVVNETGSHYALALPNGSKLILTPEQVAQIRASNGGKLIL
ncbi:uncharacterized protein LOC143216591 isoform X2 [Lasioglossum baleicum]|uniref:uncharacterized protein LOC143216591 isoform X2 n=1 Tax=Lasioglossum baleicum TaxID=434251 RepID=UPI003FCDC4EA